MGNGCKLTAMPASLTTHMATHWDLALLFYVSCVSRRQCYLFLSADWQKKLTARRGQQIKKWSDFQEEEKKCK